MYKCRLCRPKKTHVKMQIKIFSIPIGSSEAATEEMNHFLRANKIIDIKKDLALLDGNSCY